MSSSSTPPSFNLSTYYYPINTNIDTIDYSNYTLLISIPSISNVSNYSFDTLLLNSSFNKLGYINDNNIIVAVGNNNNNTILLPIELYISDKYNVILLQNRCPVLKEGRYNYVSNIISFYNILKFKDLVNISSSLSSLRIDNQLFGQQCRYYSINESLYKNNIEKIKLPLLEKSNDDDLINIDNIDIPGSQIARIFYNECEKNNIELTGILMYSNGDGQTEYLELTQTICDVLNLDIKIEKGLEFFEEAYPEEIYC